MVEWTNHVLADVGGYLVQDTRIPQLLPDSVVSSVYVQRVSNDPDVGLPFLIGLTDLGAAGTSGLYTYITPPVCFKEGSRILCSVEGKDTYLPVESLVPGTLVKTYLHGYKKIELIGSSKVYNSGNGKKSLTSLVKCTPAKFPELTDDLVLTGAHAILVSTLPPNKEGDIRELTGKIYITDDKYRLVACLDDRTEPYPDEGVYNIWHFALENEQYTWNYGVYANGLLVESASLRTMKEFSGMTLL